MVNGNLPSGWEWMTIGDVTLPIEKVDPKQKPDKEFIYLDIASIDNSSHRITRPKSYYGSNAPSRARQLVRANDVLFSTVRTYLENIAQVPEIYDGQIASTGFSVLRANELVLSKYIFYYSLTQNFLEPLNELQRGTSYPAIRDGDVRVQIIPLAPLPEQDRIVSRIEELFSDLEAGVAALERVRLGLKRYKASVLKAACEGKLLERGGELSEEWRWVKLKDFAEMRLGKMLDKEKNKGEMRPYLRNINVRWFEFDLSDIQYMRVLDNELDNISVRKGDLIVCEGGEPGRAAVWNSDTPMIIQKALHRVRLNKDVLPTYAVYCLSSDATNGRLEKYFTGSTIKHFTGESLRKYEFLLPPLEEQRRIVAEVERRLSVVSEVEAAVEAGLARAKRLRQAVLKSAFEGRL